mgnify:CR=1 FL=1
MRRAPELPNVTGSHWNGLVEAAGTPRPVIEQSNAEVSAILARPEVVHDFDEQGMISAGGSPESFGAFMRAEAERWARLVKRASILEE